MKTDTMLFAVAVLLALCDGVFAFLALRNDGSKVAEVWFAAFWLCLLATAACYVLAIAEERSNT